MAALAAPVAAATTTETFQADADAYIRWGGAVGDTNYGTSTSLFIRQSGDPWGASAGSLYRSLIRFDLSSLPEGATIESATLYGYMPARTGDREVAAYRVTGAWTETGVTWNTRPSNATQPTSVIDPGPTANVWIGWNVTQDVQAYVQGTLNHGWLLASPDESATSTEQRVTLNSRDNADSALRPYLNVTYSTGSAAPVLTTIEVSPETANLAVDATQQFAAVAKDQNDDEMTGITFDWSSSNETVGTVNATGFFAALAEGTTTVTAAAEGVTGTAQVTAAVATCDLVITNGPLPSPGSAVFALEPNRVRMIVKNNGPETATDIMVAVYASDVSETVPVNITTAIASLAGGAQTTIYVLDPTIREHDGGTVTYSAVLDPENTIVETNETNNVAVGGARGVLYNGYKGKRYWEGRSDVTTVRTYDLSGDIIHSFGDSQYMSGSFGSEGWTNYTVTWTAGDLPLPAGATVHDAWLYVPYCWDNTNSAPDNVSIDFNGVRIPYVNWYNDVSNFGAYADHYYGLLTYNVTDLYQTGANNTALFARTDTNAKISPAGFTLAVVYEDASAARKQIFINEEFDILGADEGNYGTDMAEATAYVPFSGAIIDTGSVARANLTTFVPWGNDEGNLFFNGEQIGTQVWSHGGSGATGEVGGTQVAVDEREVTTLLNATGNEAAIQSDDTWKSPVMVAGLTFLVVEYADDSGGDAPVAAFTATPLSGLAPLSVTFTDASANSPTTWSWESRPSGTTESWTEFSTDKNPTHTFEAGAYDIRLTASNAAGDDTLTEAQYISSSAGPKRLATVQSGTVSGDLYVGAYGEFSSGISGATNTLNQTFTLPAYTDIQWARLYTVVYAAGTDNRAGTVTVRFDGNGTYETLGIETLATAGDGAVNVYPVNDHVNRQYSDYLLWYDVTDRIDSQDPKAEVVATPVASNFDGRIKELVLVVAYNDGDGDEVHYWVNDGHDYQANGADGVTSTFTTGGLTTGWTDATLRNVMLSSKDALYTFNGAAYAGANSTISFGTNTWDVRNNLTAGSDSNFTYVPNGGSYKTTLATLAVKYPEAPLPSAPVANFTANVTAGDTPLTVQFNDTSTGSPTSWAWDFEDNGTVDSTEQDPVWTYAAAGTYTVNLTVTNAAGSDSEIKTGYITVSGGSPGGEAPVAAFTATPLNGLAPLAVTFADASTNSPTAWSWESRLSGTTENWTAFSTDKNPTHTFAAGAYDVCLIVSNAYGSDTVTKTQYISSSAGAKRLATVQSGTVSGDLYVGAYGGFGSGISYATNTFNRTFTLPAYTDIQWARLYTVVYAAGTDNRAGTATVRFDGNGTYATLGAETLATAGDNMANVYPVNDHVNRQYSDYLLWYDVTDRIGSEDPKAEVVATPVAPNFDGRIKELALVVAYNDGDGDQVHYWVNEGHDWQANGADGVTSTFATGGLGAGWTDATLRNVMLSSKDALYTFNGADYTGADSMITFGTNTWDVRNNLTAGSDSNFTYVPNGGSYKTTLATLAVKYPEAPLPSAPVANFTANVTAGDAPLTVQFNDTSIGSPTSWLWDFGDNTTSDQQHPVHTYTTAGTYSVNLTVTNAAGSDSEVKTGCITVSDPAGGDAPDLAASTLSSNNGEVFSASENTYTATITNIGTGDAGAFDVKFNVSGAAGTVAVDALATGAGTTVTWTDETIRNAGDIVTITVTADPDGLIAESNEENNLASIEKTVVHNGYRGMRWTDGGDIATAVTYDIRGDFLWSAGDGAYLSASTYPNWTTYTVNWTATDLSVPAGATIAGARLYVPYTWDKGPIFPEDVTLTFNGETVDRSAFYEDEKMWGSSYPYGMTVYDVTDAFSAAVNTAVLTNTFPGGGNVSIRGMLLAVVYDDGTTAPHTIFMNEGFDLLYGGEAQGTTPEQATAYAPFFGVETDDALSAALITVAPGAGPARGDLLINDERLADVWSFTGTSQIGVDERDVTALLRTGENLVGFQSSADYMEAAAAFLVLEYPALPGSILVTSTPAGAAVWLDDEDTGEVTPITLEDVLAGDHVVTLKLDGYADASKSVTVVSDETVTVDLELTTLTGSLEVTSTPEGAAILIDGADTGEVTNATLDGIGVGEHTITLRKAGYADAVAEVTIAENETTTLHLDLIEAPGSIAVVSMPEGAAIFLDGADTGKLTNALLENVAAGEHTVTVKLAGYIDASRTVTVTDNETITINFLLTEPAGSIAVTSTPDGARIFLDGTDTGEVTNATLMNVAVGKHTIRLEIDDYLDVEEIVTVTSGEIASVHFTLDASAITLQPGWNFVSTPKRLADGSNTIAVFDGVDTNGRPVLFYNGTCQWEDLSREDAFRPLDGIWIYSNGTYEIPLSFAAASTSPPPTKYLDAGWNAIGFSDTVPEPAVTTLRSVETAWANLFGWKAREQAYDDSIIRGATGKHGEMRELSPFQGYWLYMNNADTLAAIGA